MSSLRRALSWSEIEQLCQVLVGELGKHEEDGPNVGTCHKYQEVTGNDDGDSWCLSFIMWGVLQIVKTRTALLLTFGIITAGCELLRKMARKTGILLPVGTAPQKGDIGLVVDTAANHAHHAFLVKDGPGEDDSMETLEGNSNDTGGSNGDGAYRREKRFGVNDPAMQPGAKNHYELIRIVSMEDS